MTGSALERELVRLLDAHGYATMRAPSSGSATDRPLPDMIAARSPLDTGGQQELLAIEAKANSEKHIYVPVSEVADLLEFADAGGFVAYLAARWKQDHDAGWSDGCTSWYLCRPQDCHRTEKSYRLTRPDDPDEWGGIVFSPDDTSDNND